MAEEGAPGYVDKIAGRELELTLFQEGGEVAHQLKAGQQVRVAPAGVDRKPTGAPLTGTIGAAQMVGPLGKVSVTLDSATSNFQPTGLARLWKAP